MVTVKKRLLTSLGIGFLVSTLAFAAAKLLDPIQLLEYQFVDSLFQRRGTQPADTNIVIVAIDQTSLRTMDEPWPWSPNLYSRLIKTLGRRGAKAIALDQDFSRTNEVKFPGQDVFFADAIHRSNNVIIPARFEQSRSNRQSGGRRRMTVRTIFAYPIKLYEQACYAVGVSNNVPYADGAIRRFPVQVVYRDQIIPSFGLAAVGKFLDIHPVKQNAKLLARVGLNGGFQTRNHINYLGPGGTFPVIPIRDVLNGTVSADLIRNKLVLVGQTAPELGAKYPNPYSSIRNPTMASVEIHANIASSILNRNYLQTLGVFQEYALLLLITILCCVAFVFSRAWVALLVALEVIVAYYLLTLTLFSSSNQLLPMMPLLLSLPFSLLAGILYKHTAEIHYRRKLKGMFSGEVRSDKVSELIHQSEPVQIDGQRTRATMLYSDIRGFNEMAARIPKEEAVELLNKYFDLMAQILFKYDGTIERYMEKGIMAVFGVPFPREDDAERAVLAALEMQSVLKAYNESLEPQKQLPLKIGIGINTGEVTIGNIGNENRAEYMALGEAMHVASQMESLSKPFETEVIISENTFTEVQNNFITNDLGVHRLTGAGEQMRLYQVLYRKNGA